MSEQQMRAERLELFTLDGLAARMGVESFRVRHAMGDRPESRAPYFLGGTSLFSEDDVGWVRALIGRLDVPAVRVAAEKWACEAQRGSAVWLNVECLLRPEPNPEWQPAEIKHWRAVRDSGPKPPDGVTYEAVKQW